MGNKESYCSGLSLCPTDFEYTCMDIVGFEDD